MNFNGKARIGATQFLITFLFISHYPTSCAVYETWCIKCDVNSTNVKTMGVNDLSHSPALYQSGPLLWHVGPTDKKPSCR